MSSPAGPPRISQLDGLRALAIALVVLHHCVDWFEGGTLGVGIFFCLSGYLITTLLIAELRSHGSIARGRFYVRRALRLYPALIVMLLLTQLLARDPLAALIAATYTTDFALGYTHHGVGMYNHTWTLALEEQFYLVWPFLLPGVLAITTRRAIAGLLVLAVASTTWEAMASPSGLGVYNPLTNAHGLFLGCALALGLASPAARRLRIHASWGWVGLALCLAGTVVVSRTPTHLTAAAATLLAELAATVLIASLVTNRGRASRLLASRPLVWIGARSYGIYLWQSPLIWYASAHGINRFAGAGASVAVAAASWRLVEAPFLALKQRLAPRARARSRAPLPAPVAPVVLPAD
jgi:peptidoglycan/LPS O-acetylase OafA/YrhL